MIKTSAHLFIFKILYDDCMMTVFCMILYDFVLFGMTLYDFNQIIKYSTFTT